MPPELSMFENFQPLSIVSLVMHLGIGAVLSVIIRWHFRKFGSTLSNREEFAQVFPFVLLTTILIISIVKSSLALSLGLVGALSIVRFRTPIKEPEELAYLFIAIAIGLGLGAEQTLATVVAGIVILALMAGFKLQRGDNRSKNLYISIDWDIKGQDIPEKCLDRFVEIITKHSVKSDLRRFDIRDDSLEAVFFIDVAGVDNITVLMDEFRSTFPAIGITFLDQNQLPGV